MQGFIEAILALIMSFSGYTAEAPAERPVLEERAPIVINPAATLPPEVIPAEQEATIDANGTITNADGTTDCVTASPCDYARAGYAPGDTGTNHPDVDPVWDEYAEEVGS